MKYEVELAMTGIDNYWCQKPQLISIPCDHLLIVYSFRMLDYTQYVSPYYTIQMNEIGQCTTVRSLGQIQQKTIKE
jgi:hypothetical protein